MILYMFTAPQKYETFPINILELILLKIEFMMDARNEICKISVSFYYTYIFLNVYVK